MSLPLLAAAAAYGFAVVLVGGSPLEEVEHPAVDPGSAAGP